MSEAALLGVPPHLFWDYTYRELHALINAAQTKATRAHKLAMYTAYHTEAFARIKRLAPLSSLLSKLDPVRDMSAGDIRAAVMAMARSMGARVVKKSERKA